MNWDAVNVVKQLLRDSIFYKSAVVLAVTLNVSS